LHGALEEQFTKQRGRIALAHVALFEGQVGEFIETARLGKRCSMGRQHGGERGGVHDGGFGFHCSLLSCRAGHHTEVAGADIEPADLVTHDGECRPSVTLMSAMPPTAARQTKYKPVSGF
jgi:hypothetical protein